METLRYVLLANGLLMVVSIAFYGLLRRETFFQTNRLMLWLGVLSVLILPALQFPDWRPQRVKSAMQHTARVIAPKVLPQAPLPPPVTITFPNGRAYPVTTIRRMARFGWSWQLALIGAYLAGLLVLTGRFVVQLLSIRRLIRRSARQSLDDFTLVTNPAVDAPFSFLNWVVINPTRHAGDELDQVLRHERVHVRQRHSLDMLMAEAVCIVFWPNPAAYLFRRLVHQTLEFCADQAVLAEGVDARMYQYNLLKVSLSAGPLPITNSFSTSQLRDRIRMMNRQRSHWFQALRYPAVLILCLTVVTAFSRHKAEKLAAQIAVPAAQSVSILTEELTPVQQDNLAPATDSLIRVTDERIVSDTSSHLAELPISNSTTQSTLADSTYHSNSRLVVYKDDVLYWIVTPKTTLEDISGLQQELAKHQHKLQLRQIKYDPSYRYIDQIDVTVAKTGAGSAGSWDTTADGNKPIKTITGYILLGPNGKSRGVSPISGAGESFPAELYHTAASDEAAASDLFHRSDPERMIDRARLRFDQLGNGSARYDRVYFDNKSTKASGVMVKPDKSLAVDDACKTATVYINNELVGSGVVSMWTVDKLYAVIKKTRYDPVTKQATPVALLLYTIDN